MVHLVQHISSLQHHQVIDEFRFAASLNRCQRLRQTFWGTGEELLPMLKIANATLLFTDRLAQFVPRNGSPINVPHVPPNTFIPSCRRDKYILLTQGSSLAQSCSIHHHLPPYIPTHNEMKIAWKQRNRSERLTPEIAGETDRSINRLIRRRQRGRVKCGHWLICMEWMAVLTE